MPITHPCLTLPQVNVIKRMLLATVAEATPSGEEAQRALGFFINRCKGGL